MSIKTQKIDSVILLALDGNILGGPESTEINQNLLKFIEEGYKKFIIVVGWGLLSPAFLRSKKMVVLLELPELIVKSKIFLM